MIELFNKNNERIADIVFIRFLKECGIYKPFVNNYNKSLKHRKKDISPLRGLLKRNYPSTYVLRAFSWGESKENFELWSIFNALWVRYFTRLTTFNSAVSEFRSKLPNQ